MSDNEPRDLDGLDEPPAEETVEESDERDAFIAWAMERFFGGNPETSEEP